MVDNAIVRANQGHDRNKRYAERSESRDQQAAGKGLPLSPSQKFRNWADGRCRLADLTNKARSIIGTLNHFICRVQSINVSLCTRDASAFKTSQTNQMRISG